MHMFADELLPIDQRMAVEAVSDNKNNWFTEPSGKSKFIECHMTTCLTWWQ